MSDIAISVEGVGKKYRIGTPSGTDRLSEVMVGLGRAAAALPRKWLRRLRSPQSSDAALERVTGRDEFWALRDVSFEVKRGEVVGIIGRNGAGKSTLLKVLSRITAPTVGRFGVRGRVASLLEVGTGFHGELTGRENIFLSGTLLGMSRREIQHRLDEIVAFAEVDRFLDTPVKRYSSGMQMRLGFAVAAHLEADILIVDEVLAVGDAEFQKKCLGKMGEVARAGRTVLFVSHNINAILNMCSRAVWLVDGLVRSSGDTKRIVMEYTGHIAIQPLCRRWEPTEAPGGDHARLIRAAVTPVDPEGDGRITVRTALRLEFDCQIDFDLREVNYSVVVYEVERGCVFNSGSKAQACKRGLVSGEFVIPGNLLNDGLYSVRTLLIKDSSVPLFDIWDVLSFQVEDTLREGNWHGRWIGAVRPALNWKVACTANEPANGAGGP